MCSQEKGGDGVGVSWKDKQESLSAPSLKPLHCFHLLSTKLPHSTFFNLWQKLFLNGRPTDRSLLNSYQGQLNSVTVVTLNFCLGINWFVNALFCRGFSSLPQPLALPSGPIAPRIPATNEPFITLQSCGGCLFNMYGRNFFFKTYWRSSLASSPVLRICNHIALAGAEC